MPSGAAVNIQGTLHVDRWLTTFSSNFVQDARQFIATRAASVIPVLKQTDAYVTYDRGYFWRDEAQPRPLAGRPVQVGYKVGSDTYNATEYALEHVVDDRQRANVDDPIRLDEAATTLLTQKLMIKQDRLWCQRFFKPGVWTTNIVGINSTPVGGSTVLRWNNANSTPIEDIDLLRDLVQQQTGFMPNTMVLGAAVRRFLRSHPDIADRIKYTQTGIADEDVIGKLFEIDNVVVARSVYNAAAEGAADNFTFIADQKGLWLGYIDPNPGLDSPTAIANFAWTGLIPGVTNTLGGVVERGRDDRAHSDYFQGRMAFDLKQVSADLGVFVSNVIT